MGPHVQTRARIHSRRAAALCDLIHKCLSFNAKERPERASEIQGMLDHMVDKLVKTPEERLEAMEW